MLMILVLKICGFIIWYLNTKMISIIVNMLFKYSLKLEKNPKFETFHYYLFWLEGTLVLVLKAHCFHPKIIWKSYFFFKKKGKYSVTSVKTEQQF